MSSLFGGLLSRSLGDESKQPSSSRPQDEVDMLRCTPSLNDLSFSAPLDIAVSYAAEDAAEQRSAALANPEALRHLHEVLKSTRRHRSRSSSPTFDERFAALEVEVNGKERRPLAPSAPLYGSAPKNSFLPYAAAAALTSSRCVLRCLRQAALGAVVV
jgi:hypothetical protein